MVSFFSHGCIHMDSVAGDSEFEAEDSSFQTSAQQREGRES